MVDHLLRNLRFSAMAQVLGDARGPERVTTDLGPAFALSARLAIIR